KKFLDLLKTDAVPFPFHCPAELYTNVFREVYAMFTNKLFRYFEQGQEIQKSHSTLNLNK
ncbi:MAG: hypothetical protein WC071_11280, partial [Victivallaceae bacterium]